MKDDPLLTELFAMLKAQPSRLADKRLRPELFDGKHRRLLETMKRLRLRGMKQTPENVLLETKDDAVAELAGIIFAMKPSGSSVSSILDHLEDQNMRQSVQALTSAAYDSAGNPKMSVKDAIADLQANLIRLTSNGGSGLELANDTWEVDEEIKWTMQNPGKLRGPSTGFVTLDRTINGLTPRYYVVGARPSAGKSALCGNLMEAQLMESRRCALYSYEMPRKNYLMRMMSRLARVPIGAWRNSPYTSNELRALDEAKEVISKWNLFINDNAATTISEIESECFEMAASGGIDFIAIDYLQLVPGAEKSKNRNDYVSELSNRLKLMSRRLNVPVLALSQLKRLDGQFVRATNRTESRRPELSDLRESGSIEQDADVVALLHRDPLSEDMSAELIIAKQRDGGTHDGIKLNYKNTILSFEEA